MENNGEFYNDVVDVGNRVIEQANLVTELYEKAAKNRKPEHIIPLLKKGKPSPNEISNVFRKVIRSYVPDMVDNPQYAPIGQEIKRCSLSVIAAMFLVNTDSSPSELKAAMDTIRTQVYDLEQEVRRTTI